MGRLASVLIVCAGLASGCAADRRPEEVTPDGLVRAPSHDSGGVYRAPDASFTQYRRIILEPPSISFVENWREKHPEVTTAQIARMLHESVGLFREEFTREFVETGAYEFAEDFAADVLLIVPAIEELDIPAPDRGSVVKPVSMKITGELRDSLSGKVVARVITYQPSDQYSMYGWRNASRVTNAHEQRIVFTRWSRLVREALNVAKTAAPRRPDTAALDE